MEQINEKYKPTVRYRTVLSEIVIGGRVLVVTIDHPSSLVSNGHPVFTTPVVSYDPATGAFETKNTKYIYEG